MIYGFEVTEMHITEAYTEKRVIDAPSKGIQKHGLLLNFILAQMKAGVHLERVVIPSWLWSTLI